MQTVDAVIAAGDGDAARRIFQKNKTLLEISGKPIIRYIVEALNACPQVGQVVVVGPRKELEAELGELGAVIVEQKRNMTENVLEGFLHTLPEYREQNELSPSLLEAYRDKYVLGLSGDIPLLTSGELQQFISRCDMERYDFVSGYTREDVLERFGPRKGKPGIKMATFHTRDGNVRQNNLHMARVFRMMNSVDLILKVYEYRYQMDRANILRSIGEIAKLGPGRWGMTLVLYALLQLSTAFSAAGMRSLAGICSHPVTLERLEKLASSLMGVRWKTVETDIGGAALDVDNEKDFLTLSLMYRDWLELVNSRA